MKGDVIEVNPFAVQLFHIYRVQCIWLKGQIKASVYPRVTFMTVFTLPPEAIIHGRLLHGPRLWCIVTTTKEHLLVIVST